MDRLVITSPKRSKQHNTGWNAFFPYYAGFPEAFAHSLLKSAGLRSGATVLDPWNGSGTTTFAAAQLGYASQGFDLNPAMTIVARARLLPLSEADSLTPLAREMARKTRTSHIAQENDPLAQWFGSSTVKHLRNLESRVRQHLIGEMTVSPHGTHFENVSSLAATFYVALFAICRKLASSFQSSNPTWLRIPKVEERKVGASWDWIVTQFMTQIIAMAAALKKRAATSTALGDAVSCDLRLADSTQIKLQPSSVDLILTSPPYCTRIDYTAATRIELAILAPLMETTAKELSRQMIGSTCVPNHEIELSKEWGTTCGEFLLALKKHPSKASSGYYYKTHVDYFQKMGQSLSHLSTALTPDGLAILVVQDSYYKELHNDLPQIICEMGEGLGLKLIRRADFRLRRSMARVNPHARSYNRPIGPTEAVLCFQRPATSVSSAVS